jgi:hypothetical protein
MTAHSSTEHASLRDRDEDGGNDDNCYYMTT